MVRDVFYRDLDSLMQIWTLSVSISTEPRAHPIECPQCDREDLERALNLCKESFLVLFFNFLLCIMDLIKNY